MRNVESTICPYQTGAYAAAEASASVAKTIAGSNRTQPKSGACPHSRAFPLFSGQSPALLRRSTGTRLV